MAKPLTAKQQSLLKAITQELRRETAIAFIALGYTNKTQAYISACESMGKKPSKNPHTSASEILSYPNVLEFINSVKLSIAEEAKIDAAYVLKMSNELLLRCMVYGEDFSPSGAGKALDLIGKHVNVQAFNEKSTSETTLKVEKSLAERLTSASKR
jgi:phage terminase small subunit